MSGRFKGFLDAVGRDFKRLLPYGEAVVSALFPAVSPLFTLVANLIIAIEKNFAASGKQSGTGEDKAASVLAAIGNVIKKCLTDIMGQPATDADARAYVDATVFILNTTPAPAADVTPPKG